MKTLVTLLLITAYTLGFSQEKVSGKFKVYQIYEGQTYYLILLRKDDGSRYAIMSDKGIALEGKKVQADSIYYFDLYPIKDTLSAINYLDYRSFPNFSNKEIGLLCHTSSLTGITILPLKEVKSLKKNRHNRGK